MSHLEQYNMTVTEVSDCTQTQDTSISDKTSVINQGVKEESINVGHELDEVPIQQPSREKDQHTEIKIPERGITNTESSNAQQQSGRRNLYVCMECDERFSQVSDLNEHVATHELYKCYICGQTFIMYMAFVSHFKKHRTAKVFACSVCHEEIYIYAQFISHLQSHQVKSPYGCGMCGDQFMDIHYLGRHINNHTRPTSEKTEPNRNVDSHSQQPHDGLNTAPKVHGHLIGQLKEKGLLATVVNKKKDIHVCPVCKKTFIRGSAYRIHMTIHSDARCKICRKSFKSRECLAEHIKDHIKGNKKKKINQKTRTKTESNIDKQDPVNKSIPVARSSFPHAVTIEPVEMQTLPSEAYSVSVSGTCEWRLMDIKQEEPDPQDDVTHIDHSPFGSLEQYNMVVTCEASDGAQTLDTCEAKTEIHEKHINTERSNTQEQSGDGNHYVYVCMECDEQFSQASDLNEHMVTHELYKCYICGQIFIIYKAFVRHFRKHRNQGTSKVFACSICHEELHVYSRFIDHLQSHQAKSPYGCGICGAQFLNVHILGRHINNHTQLPFGDSEPERNVNNNDQQPKMPVISGSFPHAVKTEPVQTQRPCYDISSDCLESSELGNLPSYPNINMAIGSGNQELHPYRCMLCDVTFIEMTALKAHITVHELCKCVVCGHSLSTQAKFISHMRTHSKVNRFVCFECGEELTSMLQLKRHLLKHPEQRPYGCNICKQLFGKYMMFAKHMEGHNVPSCEQNVAMENQSTKKPEGSSFKCSVCGLHFLSVQDLFRHSVIHEDFKPYACFKCERQSYDLKDLKLHILNHPRDTPYGCNICGRNFTIVSALEKHLHDHKALTKSWKSECSICTICSYMNSDYKQLKNHVQTHLELSKYKCTQCSAAFRWVRPLEDHVAMHGKQGQFQCCFCDRYFENKGKWQNHIKAHLGKNSEIGQSANDPRQLGDQATDVKALQREVTYTCSVCETTFNRLSYYHSHMKVHFDDAQKPFNTKADHLQTIKIEKREWSNSLNSNEVQVSAILQSKNVHGETTPYQSYSFPQQGEKFQPVPKPFKCVRCRKRFATFLGYIRHARIHPKVCFYCNKGFSSHLTLHAHERTHRGEVPYVCSCCDETFATFPMYKAHRSVMDSKFKCALCMRYISMNKTEKLKFLSQSDQHLLCSSCSEKSAPILGPPQPEDVMNNMYGDAGNYQHLKQQPVASSRVLPLGDDIAISQTIKLEAEYSSIFVSDYPQFSFETHSVQGETNGGTGHSQHMTRTSDQCSRAVNEGVNMSIRQHIKVEPEESSTFHSDFPNVAFEAQSVGKDESQLSCNPLEGSSSGQAPYVCSCCDQVFASLSFLVKHERKMERTFLCCMCNKRRNKKKTLCYLLQGHQLGCGICIVPYNHPNHAETIKGISPAPQTEYCTDCGQSFTVHGLVEHKEFQISGAYYQCCLCVGGFVDTDDMTTHMASHC